jgi:adenylylsulfate kinase
MEQEGFVIWLTGLSGAGKTTIALALEERLLACGQQIVVLDGDRFRRDMGDILGYSYEHRMINIHCMGYLAKILAGRGISVLVAAISPYRKARNRWKEEIERFAEIYVCCPLEVCRQRDVKGLYALAAKGAIKNFTAVSDPYEHPLNPDMTVYTHKETISRCVDDILNFLKQKGYL